jgi:glycosyltransferase involved in cell wall biosynthesis
MNSPPSTNAPLVSVIVPCYNCELHVEEALESVFRQTYRNFEIILVDDVSTDSTSEILQRCVAFDARCRLYRMPENSGAAAARNYGIGKASGRFIAFIDSDDYWHPSKLEKQLRALEEHSEYIACYTDFKRWSPLDDTNFPAPGDLFFEVQAGGKYDVDNFMSGWIYDELLLDCCVWTSAVMIRKSALDHSGGFNEQFVIGEDHDLWLRLSAKGKFLKLAEPLALYRQLPGSLTRRIYDTNYSLEIFDNAIRDYGTCIGGDSFLSPQEVADRRRRIRFRFAYEQLWQGSPEVARHEIVELLRDRFSVKLCLYWLMSFFPMLRIFKNVRQEKLS